MAEARLVLASASPRRRELLARLGVRFEVRAPHVHEALEPGEDPTTHVERLARAKAAAVLVDAAADEVVLAADTTVDLLGSVLGKPTDATDAAVMLRALSGQTHRVHTAVVVAGPGPDGPIRCRVTTTVVRFRELGTDEVAAYVATGDPLDKAGAYGIQGEAGRFVASLSGSASNVVGLPVGATATLLSAAGLEPVRWGPPRG